MSKPPVSFADKASASKKGGSGYPVQISAKDLDANFLYATMQISDTSPRGEPQPFAVDEITGQGGHTQRRLIFKPAAPSKDAVFAVSGGSLAWLQVPPTGTHVLGVKDGALAWIATEEC